MDAHTAWYDALRAAGFRVTYEYYELRVWPRERWETGR